MSRSTYYCKHCPIAFRIGGGLTHDGCVDTLVCSSCGTMHRLTFHQADSKSDDWQNGSSELLAMPGPFRSPLQVRGRTGHMQDKPLPDWIKVADFQNRQALNSLACSHCKSHGRLIDGKGLYTNASRRPSCPLCKEQIECTQCVQSR